MGIDFSSPWLLLLLLPACYVLIRWWRGERHMPASRKAVILALRTLVFLLLILTLAGTQLLTPVKGKTVVFVVDRSASMKDDPRLAAFLREAVSRKQPQDQYAVVAVGEKAAVDQPLTTRDEVQPLGVEVNRNATHLAEGIRLAAAMIPSQARGKVVVLTDGVATGGDAERETRLAVDRGIAVEAVSMQQPQGDEVLLAAVQVPERLYAGEEFAISVDVESTLSTGATLRLYEGNREAGSQKVAIEKGKNRFVFSQKAIQQGFHRFRVEIEPERDTVRANNQATAYTGVAGAPVVLVVEGHPGAASNLTQALKAGNMAVEVKDARLLPKELDGLSACLFHDLNQVGTRIGCREIACQHARSSRLQPDGLALHLLADHDRFQLLRHRGVVRKRHCDPSRTANQLRLRLPVPLAYLGQRPGYQLVPEPAASSPAHPIWRPLAFQIARPRNRPPQAVLPTGEHRIFVHAHKRGLGCLFRRGRDIGEKRRYCLLQRSPAAGSCTDRLLRLFHDSLSMIKRNVSDPHVPGPDFISVSGRT